MKKLFLLPLLLFFVGCATTDDLKEAASSDGYSENCIKYIFPKTVKNLSNEQILLLITRLEGCRTREYLEQHYVQTK